MDVNHPLYRDFGLAAVQLSPFVGELRDPSHAKMALIYSIGRHMQYNKCDKISERVSAIGELLAPQLDKSRTLNEMKARQKLVDVIRTLLLSEELSKISKLDTKIWNRECAEGGFLERLVFKRENERSWPTTIPITKRSFCDRYGKNLLTPETAMAILALITINSKPFLRDEILCLLLGMHLGLLERGYMPKDLLPRMKEVKTKLKLDLNLRKELVEAVYKTYKDDFDDHVARKIFVFWDSWVDPRIRMYLQPEVKDSFEKLSAINTIKKAIISYPDFPWEVLALDLNIFIELKHVLKAMSLISSNPYYVYKKDYCVIEPSNYANIEAAAKTLLEKSLNKTSTLKGKLREVIENYFEGHDITNKRNIPLEVSELIKEIKLQAGIIVPKSGNCATLASVQKRIDSILEKGCMEKSYTVKFT